MQEKRKDTIVLPSKKYKIGQGNKYKIGQGNLSLSRSLGLQEKKGTSTGL